MIDAVRAGETVVVAYGRNQEKVAALVPYDQLTPPAPRTLGILAGSASVRFAEDFAISDEELLGYTLVSRDKKIRGGQPGGLLVLW